MKTAKSVLAYVSILLLSFSMSNANIDYAVLGGGCFWCLEAIFERVDGVKDVISGYAGGHTENPKYKEVCSGSTGHAEVIKILYDSNKISYNRIIEIFLSTHDPTTKNRQGNDIGTQYRSIILYNNPKQKLEAIEVIEKINKSGTLRDKIVTEVIKINTFYNAEIEHQDYYKENPNAPYCNFVIRPKINKAKKHNTDIK